MVAQRSNARFIRLTIALLILFGALAVSACPSLSPARDDDRPPIIISGGSVNLEVQNARWTGRGNKDYDQDVTDGKSVTSLSAQTLRDDDSVECTIQGSTIMVMYGSRLIVFTIKNDRVNQGRRATNAQFPANATVEAGQAANGRLRVDTTDSLASVWNESGDSCSAVGLRIKLVQVH